jgi:DNA-binding CsgD family transcriptional regulator
VRGGGARSIRRIFLPAIAGLTLALAVVVDRAKGRLGRRDPDRALAEWKGLVAARWTLVDLFDHDGKDYLVARKNDADTGGLDLLSPRERQAVGYASLGHSNKLGLSSSTVGVLLWRAASKLGARSRAELIAAFRRRSGRPVE